MSHRTSVVVVHRRVHPLDSLHPRPRFRLCLLVPSCTFFCLLVLLLVVVLALLLLLLLLLFLSPLLLLVDVVLVNACRNVVRSGRARGLPPRAQRLLRREGRQGCVRAALQVSASGIAVWRRRTCVVCACRLWSRAASRPNMVRKIV